MRLLAIDPGSQAIGFAYFVDEQLERTDLIRTSRGLLENRRYIAEQFRAGAAARRWYPDVVAIEAVYVGANTVTALTMAETVGYLECVLDELYPRRMTKRIHRATICKALGLKGNAGGDDKRRAARERFPQLRSQDECDAAAVGISAIASMSDTFARVP